eukprot:Blabericola_migrator_1__13017@NODE_870_length_6205_cov_91_425220_g615_i0_p1_GENE_NODE_870_length_6205_cov_91_425220_g615_i0NODE_870_length_6205_cov_91_425220_g615_i0_p1_ORF_typecomplete_len887_score129_97_NODE_870_length_6205_cov_91_425220_g615_i023174977
MTRSLRTSYLSKDGASLLVRIAAVLLCPKSLDVDSLYNDGDTTQQVFDSSFRLRMESSSPPPSVEIPDITEETKNLTTPMINLTRSPSSSDEIKHVSPFKLCDKRSCNQQAGPSQKRSLSDKSTTTSFTLSDAQSACSSLKLDLDVSGLQLRTQPKISVSAVLERYDAIMRNLIRIPATISGAVRPIMGTRLETWVDWVSLFTPSRASEQRQDGIAALALLRHMISRQGFMRFVTELASLSQTSRTHRDHVRLVQEFLDAHDLLSEPSPLRVTKKVKWDPLRQLVETGECPAWLLHKALQDQIDAAGPLRPFLSFLAAAAEVYKGLPEQILRELEKEVEPENFFVHQHASFDANVTKSRAQRSADPSVKGLLKLRSLYFDSLKLKLSQRLTLTALLSCIGAMRYIRPWSPAETFVLDLANAMGVYRDVANKVAERPSTAAYWQAMPQLIQLVSVDTVAKSRRDGEKTKLEDECKDLRGFLKARLTLGGQQSSFADDLDAFWCLAGALYEMLTSSEPVRAAVQRNTAVLDEMSVPKDHLSEEDVTLSEGAFLEGRPLATPKTVKDLPIRWHGWAALRETVLPEGTSHRDMEALVDIQLRPYVDHSHNVMNFISGIATVMWPREWFQKDVVSSYDELLEYFHLSDHLKGEPAGLNMFYLVDFSSAEPFHLRKWVRQRECTSVMLRAALRNESLYNLLIRAANLFPHVKDEFSQRRLVLTSCFIPDFPQSNEAVKDRALNTFRAHAAHFLEPDDEFRKMLRVLLSIRSFNELSAVEQVVLDLAAALCVSLPGEHGHNPFWISAETFHSIMARRPKWKHLFASPNVSGSLGEACWLFVSDCSRLTTLFGNICAEHSSDGAIQLEHFDRLVNFAQYVVKASNEEWRLEQEC